MACVEARMLAESTDSEPTPTLGEQTSSSSSGDDFAAATGSGAATVGKPSCPEDDDMSEPPSPPLPDLCFDTSSMEAIQETLRGRYGDNSVGIIHECCAESAAFLEEEELSSALRMGDAALPYIQVVGAKLEAFKGELGPRRGCDGFTGEGGKPSDAEVRAFTKFRLWRATLFYQLALGFVSAFWGTDAMPGKPLKDGRQDREAYEKCIQASLENAELGLASIEQFEFNPWFPHAPQAEIRGLCDRLRHARRHLEHSLRFKDVYVRSQGEFLAVA